MKSHLKLSIVGIVALFAFTSYIPSAKSLTSSPRVDTLCGGNITVYNNSSQNAIRIDITESATYNYTTFNLGGGQSWVVSGVLGSIKVKVAMASGFNGSVQIFDTATGALLECENFEGTQYAKADPFEIACAQYVTVNIEDYECD